MPNATIEPPKPRFSSPIDLALDSGSVDRTAMVLTYKIVTRGDKPNRYGSKVQIAEDEATGIRGLILDHHRDAGAPVLVEHGMSYPFAVATSIDPKTGEYKVAKSAGQAKANAYFFESDPNSVMFFAMAESGIFPAASIGFLPRLYSPIDKKRSRKLPDGVHEMYQWDATDYLESELTEWSICSTGVDRGAIRQCLEKGKVGEVSITEQAKPYLVGLAAPRTAWGCGWSPDREVPTADSCDRGEETVTVPPQKVGFTVSTDCVAIARCNTLLAQSNLALAELGCKN